MTLRPATDTYFGGIQEAIDTYIDDLSDALYSLNLQIHDNPEVAFAEHKAHNALSDFLEEVGFTVTRHAYGISTAFEAKYGGDGRCINFNSEYDALPGIGHACGHNLIATAGLTGFLALSFALKKFGIKGRTQLLGTPGEEDGGGKIMLLEAGAYKNVDLSLMIHPMSENAYSGQGVIGTAGKTSIANVDITCEYHGVSAHAAGNPWDGVNALDAVVSTYNNVSMLRQQIHPEERIHSCILQAPKVTNAIPELTIIKYSMRSPTIRGAEKLAQRVRHCIEAGALATGCEISVATEPIYADLRVNEPLCELFRKNLSTYGLEILTTQPDKPMSGSTDQGNVSYAVPALHAIIGIPTAQGSHPHDRSFTAATAGRTAHDRIIQAGKAMALSGLAALTDENGVFTKIREDFKRDEKLR